MTDDELDIFEKELLLEGFSVAVLDDWGIRIRRRFLTQKEKELYIQAFGYKLIKDSEFYSWYKNLKG